jgi:hypothetical protein
MKLAIMQPYAFPYIGYFQLINSVDTFVILDDVNFIKRGWINRNKILVNGEDYLFTIPVKEASQNRKINECEISEGNWNEKFLKTLKFNYSKAPFYFECINVLTPILTHKETNLSKWIFFQISEICKCLNINTTIIESSVIFSNSHLKAQEKIIDICKKEGATFYHNAIGGKELYDQKDFKNNGIILKFLNTFPVKYHQFNIEFVPFLSIIDHLMFNSVTEIQNQLNNYELI